MTLEPYEVNKDHQRSSKAKTWLDLQPSDYLKAEKKNAFIFRVNVRSSHGFSQTKIK